MSPERPIPKPMPRRDAVVNYEMYLPEISPILFFLRTAYLPSLSMQSQEGRKYICLHLQLMRESKSVEEMKESQFLYRLQGLMQELT